MRPQPLIAVTDVEASSRWFQRLLGCRSNHGGSAYEQLVSNGQLILQLHNFEVEHHHGAIGNRDDKPYGNGVLLWFEVDDFEAVVASAPPRWASRLSYRAIEIPPMVTAGRITGNAGCETQMATWWSLPVPTVQPTEHGVRSRTPSARRCKGAHRLGCPPAVRSRTQNPRVWLCHRGISLLSAWFL